MSAEEFRADFRDLLKRHDLEADDLRELAADLNALATKWEAMEEAI